MSTITVTNVNDSGTGSLRDALSLANDGDTITFDPSLAGRTLVLTSGELDTSKNITIEGVTNADGTPAITISGNNASRVFNFGGATSDTLDGLVIVNGNVGGAGGALLGQSLTVINSRLDDNSASGGIGGAIFASASLTLINSAIDHNSALIGGGINVLGFANIVNSTLSENSAQTGGGAYVTLGNLTVVNGTLSGNSASGDGGGIYARSGTTRILDSTLTGNYSNKTGGIAESSGFLTLSNSIVAGNYGGEEDDVAGPFSTIYFKGNNILGSSPTASGGSIVTTNGSYEQIDGTSGAALATVFAQVGNNLNTGVLSGVLANNGGPVGTVAINPAGIAYNAGSNTALPPDTFDLNGNNNTTEPLPVDARGFSRVVGGTVDIGAFEQQQGTTFVVTTLADNPVGAHTPGLSLRQAIALANQDPTSADTITFAPDLVGGNIAGVNDGRIVLANGNGALTINGNVSIDGDVNGHDITVDAQGLSQDFVITSGAVALNNLGITGGVAPVDGGGVSLGYGANGPANVTIYGSVLTNDQAAFGGGISVDPGDSLALINSTITESRAAYVGGGIANQGSLVLRGTTVSVNQSGYTGGGIANAGTLIVLNSTISNNQVINGTGSGIYDSAGGGLYNSGLAALANTTIAGNTGAYAGGGIYNSEGLQLTNVTIANNSATNGGGLYNAPCGCGNATIYDSTFTGNYGNQFGGGIDNANGTVTLTNSLVAGNGTGYQGSDVESGPLATTNYAGVNLFSQSGIGRPGTDIIQPDLTQVFARLTTIDPDGIPNSGDEFQAGTLANNNGAVETVAIKAGGNAQDTGSTADLPPNIFNLDNSGNTTEALPVDARGLMRVFGPAVDIGAFEAQGGPSINNVPVSANYTEHAPPVELSPAFGSANAVTVTDVDATELSGATVAITTGALATDVLAADTAGTNISASYDAATGTLTLTGTDTLTDYSQVLDSVTFSSPGGNPTDFGLDRTRTVTWSASDVNGLTDIPFPGTTITITATPSVPFDLNGDGISDLVFQNNGTPGIWLWNGSAATAEAELSNPGASWRIITSRDVNADGNADLIWQNSNGTPGIWLMNGTTPIAEAGLTNPGPTWNLVAAGDVNGDGNADLVWQDTSGDLGVWEMNGTTPIAEAGIGNPGPNWSVVGTADFNSDGKDDILLQNSATGNLQIDLMNGTSVASTASIALGDPSWHAVSTGEFGGQAEIAWQNNNGTVGLWLMNGTTPVAEAALSSPGAGWQLVSIDHFTPNRQADLLFQNVSGALMLWEMNGTSIAATLNLPSAAGWQSVNGHPFATG